MELIPAKIPSIVQSIFPGIIWSGKNHSCSKSIFLTFDDGPDPISTLSILGILQEFGVQATFFLTGENVERHQFLMEELQKQNHEVANHGFHHVDGWRISLEDFIKNVEGGRRVTGSNYFRPPYGRMTLRQYNWARKSSQLVLWTVMPGDFMLRLSPERIIARATKHAAPGDVIVLHDHPKFKDKVDLILPQILENFLSSGFIFRTISSIHD
jgi:peptidoglycan/xylan/chitin deacetylase (PgdA/CDA1 family)